MAQKNAMNVELLREFSGLTQAEFWSKVGVTQSGGSRYEAHARRLPKPVQHLLRLIYIEKVDLSRVKREDIELIEYLRTEDSDLYERLRKQSRKWARSRPLN